MKMIQQRRIIHFLTDLKIYQIISYYHLTASSKLSINQSIHICVFKGSHVKAKTKRVINILTICFVRKSRTRLAKSIESAAVIYNLDILSLETTK